MQHGRWPRVNRGRPDRSPTALARTEGEIDEGGDEGAAKHFSKDCMGDLSEEPRQADRRANSCSDPLESALPLGGGDSPRSHLAVGRKGSSLVIASSSTFAVCRNQCSIRR